MAKDGTAMQSSTLGNYDARLAIDGNPDPGHLHGSCIHTLIQDDPWWIVTFKSLVLVKEVTIVNRAYCCGTLLDGFILSVST